MMADQTPLTISLTVLHALCKIEVDILESMDETDHKFEYDNSFFDTFKGYMYKSRDVHFTYELAANTT
jgi:hypothetical protein